jgi:hypothetical protein
MMKQVVLIQIVEQNYLKTEIHYIFIAKKWILKKKYIVSMIKREMIMKLETDQNIFKKDIIVKCMISKQDGFI